MVILTHVGWIFIYVRFEYCDSCCEVSLETFGVSLVKYDKVWLLLYYLRIQILLSMPMGCGIIVHVSPLF